MKCPHADFCALTFACADCRCGLAAALAALAAAALAVAAPIRLLGRRGSLLGAPAPLPLAVVLLLLLLLLLRPLLLLLLLLLLGCRARRGPARR